MSRLSELLQEIIDNPDDLSRLPQLVAMASQLETENTDYLDRIARLQDINKSYLAQIPIPGADPVEEEVEEEPTLEEAVEYIIESLGGNK